MENLDPVDTNVGKVPWIVVRAANGERLDQVTEDEFDALRIFSNLTQKRVVMRGGFAKNRMKKHDEHVYVAEDGVYKWFKDHSRARLRMARCLTLRGAAPDLLAYCGGWYKYAYACGDILTDCATTDNLEGALNWLQQHMWSAPYHFDADERGRWVRRFYRDKTIMRTERYKDQAVNNWLKTRVWNDFAAWAVLTPTWHGDCSFENLVNMGSGKWRVLDWREDQWGDAYYDLAKMLKSVRFKHDTLNSDGRWSAHRNAADLEKLMKRWCETNGYDWSHVLAVHAIAVLAMSGSHDGDFGQGLFNWGKRLIIPV